LDINDEPVADVPVRVTLKDQTKDLVSNHLGQVNVSFTPAKGDSEIKVSATTADSSFIFSEQASAEHFLRVHDSPIAQLTIMNKKSEYKVGEYLETDIMFEGSTFLFTHIYYFVIVRNCILHFGKIIDDQYLKLKLENHMAPEMRLVVFTFGYARILADSLKINIVQDCHLSIGYENKDGVRVKQIRPGEEGRLVINGTEDQEIAVLAVDEAVYALRNKERLIKKKLNNVVKSRQNDCGPGGGTDPFDVMFNSGLIIVGHKSSLGSFCKGAKKRNRRSMSNSFPKFSGFALRCCLLGREPDRKMRKCESRASILATYISDNECYLAFLKCCQSAEPFQPHLRLSGILIQRENAGPVHVAHEREIADATFVRSDFRETWLFELIKPNKSVYKHNITAPHSITTWLFNAISLSPTQGICMLDEPLKLTVFQSIFMQVTLPYSVMRREQVEMLVTLFNYQNKTIPVLVYLIGEKDICTEAEPGEKARKYVILSSNSFASVSFPMVLLKTGEFKIHVKSLSYEGSDALIQTLHVVPQGKMLINYDVILSLAPSYLLFY